MKFNWVHLHFAPKVNQSGLPQVARGIQLSNCVAFFKKATRAVPLPKDNVQPSD